jgi:hypothetical protein
VRVLDGGSVSHVSMHRHLPVGEVHRIFSRGLWQEASILTLPARLSARGYPRIVEKFRYAPVEFLLGQRSEQVRWDSLCAGMGCSPSDGHKGCAKANERLRDYFNLNSRSNCSGANLDVASCGEVREFPLSGRNASVSFPCRREQASSTVNRESPALHRAKTGCQRDRRARWTKTGYVGIQEDRSVSAAGP